MAEIIWSNDAEQDLDDLFDYLVPRDARAALNYLDDIWTATNRLAEFPELGRAYDGAYRALVVRNHLVFYRIEADRVYVVAVIDGRRDVAKLIKGLK